MYFISERSLEQLVRFRCEPALKARLKRLSRKLKRKHEALARDAVEAFIAAAEAREGLPPITPQEVEFYLHPAGQPQKLPPGSPAERASQQSPPAPKRPVVTPRRGN